MIFCSVSDWYRRICTWPAAHKNPIYCVGNLDGGLPRNYKPQRLQDRLHSRISIHYVPSDSDVSS